MVYTTSHPMELTEDFILAKPEGCQEFYAHRARLKNISSTPDGFLWLLGGLVGFQAPAAQDYAVKEVDTWLLMYFYRIPQEIYPVIQNVLFREILPTKRFQEDPGFRKVIHIMQVHAMSHFYPEIWPTFWNDLLAMPGELSCAFLYEFGDLMDTTERSNSNTERVLSAMLTDGNQERILNCVMQNADTGGKGSPGMRLLPRVFNWVDSAFCLAQGVIGWLLEHLPVDCEVIMDCFVSIFKRNLSPDLLNELLTQLQLAERIGACASSLSPDDLRSCARFIQKIIYSNMNVISCFPSYLELALNLLKTADGSIVTDVKQYLVAMAKPSHIEFDRTVIINAALDAMMLTITNPTEETSQVVYCCCRILDMAASCNGQGFAAYLVQFAGGLDLEKEMPKAAALLRSLKDYMSSSELRNDVAAMFHVCEAFKAILDIPPQPTNAYCVALGAYAVLFQDVLMHSEEVDGTFVRNLFIVCANCLVASIDGDSVAIEDLRRTICFIIQNFCHLLGEIPNLGDLVMALVQTDRSDMAKLISKMIAKVDAPTRHGIYSELVPRLVENSFDFQLGFIKHMNLEGCEALVEPMAGLMTAMKSRVERSDRTKFVQAAVRCLRHFAFLVIADLLPPNPDYDLLSKLARPELFEYLEPGNEILTRLTMFLITNVCTERSDSEMCFGERSYLNETRKQAVRDVIEFVTKLFMLFDDETRQRVSAILCQMCYGSQLGFSEISTIVDFILQMPDDVVAVFVRELQPAIANTIMTLVNGTDVGRKQKRREKLMKLLEVVARIYDAETNPMLDFIASIFPAGCTDDLVAHFQLVMEGLHEDPDEVSPREAKIMIDLYRAGAS